MNDSQSDALGADELDADGLEAWLSDLPFWCEVDARHEFLDDLLWQLGADNDSGCTGQPEHDFSGVADAGYAACRDADPATAAAAIAELCTKVGTAADASASDVLLASVLDRGVDIDMPFRVAPLAGLSGDATPAPGASLREPYPGPRAFQVVDAPIFFGRGLETRQLLRLLAPGRASRHRRRAQRQRQDLAGSGWSSGWAVSRRCAWAQRQSALAGGHDATNRTG